MFSGGHGTNRLNVTGRGAVAWPKALILKSQFYIVTSSRPLVAPPTETPYPDLVAGVPGPQQANAPRKIQYHSRDAIYPDAVYGLFGASTGRRGHA